MNKNIAIMLIEYKINIIEKIYEIYHIVNIDIHKLYGFSEEYLSLLMKCKEKMDINGKRTEMLVNGLNQRIEKLEKNIQNIKFTDKL